jgi:hypothetical protein
MTDRQSRSRWLVTTVISVLGAGAGLVAIAQFVGQPRPVMSDFEMGIDRYGGIDYNGGAPAASVQACSDACLSEERCQAYSFNVSAKQCWLKENVPLRVENSGFVSGVKGLRPWWKVW